MSAQESRSWPKLSAMRRQRASSPAGISAPAPSSAWPSIWKAARWPRCVCPTDLWTEGGVSELNLMQLEGQARASTRAIAAQLRELGRLHDWVAGGISATHHTAGRIDADHIQVRRAICWNDHTPAPSTTPAAWSGSAGPSEVRATDRRPVGDPLFPQPPGQG